MTGESWLAVETMDNAPASSISHTQPEPNRATPAASNLVLKSENEPKVSSMAAASSPSGAPPPSHQLIHSQKRVWL